MKALTTLIAIALTASSAVLATDFPEGSPKFKTELAAAMAQGKNENKPVIAIISASWCPPCQRMKRDVYPSDTVKPFHDKFVWAYLDADAPSNEAAIEKFGVSGIPHIVFLDSSGNPDGKQEGASSPESFATTLAQMLKKASGASSTASNDKK